MKNIDIKGIIKNFTDVTFLKFLIVGVINTLFGTAIMFISYNAFNVSYNISVFMNYFFGSILSYFLNKYFTFKNKENSLKQKLLFAVNVVICMLIAYGLAKPSVRFALSSMSEKMQGNISMLVGTGLFTILNYIGQKWFVFNIKDKVKNEIKDKSEKEEVKDKGKVISNFLKVGISVIFSFVILLTIIQNVVMHLQIKAGQSFETTSFEKQHLSLFLPSIIGVIVVIILSTLFIAIQKKLTPKKRKILNILLISGLIIVNIISSIWWLKTTYATPSEDPGKVLENSYLFYKGEEISFNDYRYFAKYPQQITLMFYQALVMKIANVSNFEQATKVFYHLNTIYYIATFIVLYFIFKHMLDMKNRSIKKKYGNEENKYSNSTIITGLLFLNLPLLLLTVVIYGDIPGMFFSFLSAYLILKGLDKKKLSLLLLAIITMTLAIIVRKNSLIFLLAICIMYGIEIISNLKNICSKLKDNLISKKEKIKEVLFVLMILPVFILPIFIPSIISKSYLKTVKYEKIHNVEAVPVKTFLTMGMSESYKAPGWFNAYNFKAYDDDKIDNEYYNTAIKERIKYFKEHPKYFLGFYFFKTASLWAEPTYNAVYYINLAEKESLEADKDAWTAYFKLLRNNPVSSSLYDGEYSNYLSINSKIIQYTVLLFAFIYIVDKIRKKKELSKTDTVLMLIFLGGYAFHILWEGKARYIIGYHLALFPLAFMGLTIFSNKIIEKIISKKKQKI